MTTAARIAAIDGGSGQSGRVIRGGVHLPSTGHSSSSWGLARQWRPQSA